MKIQLMAEHDVTIGPSETQKTIKRILISMFSFTKPDIPAAPFKRQASIDFHRSLCMFCVRLMDPQMLEAKLTLRFS